MAYLIHIIDEMQIGGAQTHLVTMLRQMQNLQRHQHEVWSLFEDGPIGSVLRDLKIPVRSLNLRGLLRNHRYDRAISVLTSQLNERNPDLVEAHLTWSRLLGLWAAKRAGVERRLGFEQGDIYLSGLPFRIANFGSQFFAERIVVCSYALSRWVQKTHFISPRRLTVLHNCVDTRRFHPSNRATRPTAWPKVNTLFGAVGTLGTGVNKRMDICIRAVAIARSEGADVGLIICGDGDQRLALENLIADLGLQSVVRILGMRDDIPTIIASCDAFCHSAPFEPFGIVCLEAMASGIPVIVPDSGGIREAVDSGTCGWTYPALDERALAKSMVSLSGDPALCREMGKSARETAVSRFSVERYVDRLSRVYNLN